MAVDNEFHIFFSIDDNYVKYLSVTMASILKNAKKDDQYNFYILHNGISAHNKEKLETLNLIKAFNIEYININLDGFEKPSNSAKYITENAYGKFMIASIKPELEKALYLDADLIVHADIGELWRTNLNNNPIGAIRDNELYLKEKLDYFSKFDWFNIKSYFNSGVLLINIKEWNINNWAAALTDINLANKDTFMHVDQDSFNCCFAKKVTAIEPKWNLMAKNYINDNAGIVHYAGSKKPWLHPFIRNSRFFWNYAALSPFFGDLLYEAKQSDEMKFISIFKIKYNLARYRLKAFLPLYKKKKIYIAKKICLYRNKLYIIDFLNKKINYHK